MYTGHRGVRARDAQKIYNNKNENERKLYEETVHGNGCRNFTLSYIRHVMCTEIIPNNIL